MAVGLAGSLVVLLPGTALPQDAAMPALTREQIEIACGPRIVSDPPPAAVRIVGSHEGVAKRMYGPRDGLVIGAGSADGLLAGQWYYVRRFGMRQVEPYGQTIHGVRVQTAGWIRVIEVQTQTSIAEVLHACFDGILQDDHLEPFVAPEAPAGPVGSDRPDYTLAGRLLPGEDNRQTAGPGQLMLIDKGAADGVVLGQRLTVFRDPFGPNGPVTELGGAMVVETLPRTSMIRVDWGRDAMQAGDRIALHPVPR